MFDPYSGLSILMHGVISLSDATSYDKKGFRLLFVKSNSSLRRVKFLLFIHCLLLSLSIRLFLFNLLCVFDHCLVMHYFVSLILKICGGRG